MTESSLFCEFLELGGMLAAEDPGCIGSQYTEPVAPGSGSLESPECFKISFEFVLTRSVAEGSADLFKSIQILSHWNKIRIRHCLSNKSQASLGILSIKVVGI